MNRIVLALLAFSAVAALPARAQEASNLKGMSLCVSGSGDDVYFDDLVVDQTRLRRDVVAALRSRLTSARVPFQSQDSCVDKYVYVAFDMLKGSGDEEDLRTYVISVRVRDAGIPEYELPVTVWETFRFGYGTNYTDAEFNGVMLETFRKAVDSLGAAWIKANPRN